MPPDALPIAVRRALAQPEPGREGVLQVDGAPWGFRGWGAAGGSPVLLVHGVTSDSGIWWRVGPALAAAGNHVMAVDLPGHGRTPWRGRHLLGDTAEDLAAFIRSADLDVPDLAVIGHSWGAMVSANLPAAGIRPRVLILLDPPFMTLEQLEALTREPTERPYDTFDAATAAVRASNPTWSDRDVEAKARALVEFEADAVLAVLLQNGDWDAGLSALSDPRSAGVPAWLIRGEAATGGFIPDSALPAIEAQLGVHRVVTIAGGPHSPQRTHPEATVEALLRALRSG
jgi:pimeloyl-ACP methyl ester carboxylesterase